MDQASSEYEFLFSLKDTHISCIVICLLSLNFVVFAIATTFLLANLRYAFSIIN
jgi:hypothetical protein